MKAIKNIQNLGPLRVCVYGDDSIKYVDNYSKEDAVDTKTVPIFGLYKQHFFIDEEVNISEVWVQNFDKCHHISKFHANTNISQVDGNYFRPKKTTTRIGIILRQMMKCELFEEIKELNQHNFKD